MPKQYESRIVSFSKEKMFKLVADIDNYSDFLPWCNNSKIINREIKNGHEILIADLEIGYDQFIYTYRSEVILLNDMSSINVKNVDGPFSLFLI